MNVRTMYTEYIRASSYRWVVEQCPMGNMGYEDIRTFPSLTCSTKTNQTPWATHCYGGWNVLAFYTCGYIERLFPTLYTHFHILKSIAHKQVMYIYTEQLGPYNNTFICLAHLQVDLEENLYARFHLLCTIILVEPKKNKKKRAYRNNISID